MVEAIKPSHWLDEQNRTEHTDKPVLSSHTRESQKWPLKAGGCLMEVTIRTKLIREHIVWLLQTGWLLNRGDR